MDSRRRIVGILRCLGASRPRHASPKWRRISLAAFGVANKSTPPSLSATLIFRRRSMGSWTCSSTCEQIMQSNSCGNSDKRTYDPSIASSPRDRADCTATGSISRPLADQPSCDASSSIRPSPQPTSRSLPVCSLRNAASSNGSTILALRGLSSQPSHTGRFIRGRKSARSPCDQHSFLNRARSR